MSKPRSHDDRVVRFSRWACLQHGLVILLFVTLLVTGLPQKWPYADLSRWLITELGGVQAARWLHRAAGFVFAALTALHLATVVAGLALRRMQPTMLLTRQDFRDAVANLRYYLGHSPHPPRFGRYDYKQKFEYWGMMFGSFIMIGTGLVLYLPVLTSRLLPAEIIPAAKVMHSSEALLAFLIVIVWHMYDAILSPEVFPLDTSIFTGKISRERMRHEHPLEYEERFGAGEHAAMAATTATAATAAGAGAADEPVPVGSGAGAARDPGTGDV